MSKVSFSISLPVHCLHIHIKRELGKERGKFFFMIFTVLGNMKRVFFLKNLFLHVVRHPADSDGRPTAGAQVRTGQGINGTMTSEPLWASTALQSAVTR